MDREFEKMFQDHMDREAERIWEQVCSNPEVLETPVPDELRDKVFDHITEFRTSYTRRSAEEQELIRLGKKYKKTKKWYKASLVLAATITVLSVSVTCLGGPEKIMQKVEGMLEGKEQINVDSDGESTEGIQVVSEVDAYEQIKEKFKFDPVQLAHMPKGLEFSEVEIDEIMQKIQLIYQDGAKVLSYMMYPNYRMGSIGIDVEDNLLEEYEVSVKNTNVTVQKYSVEENGGERTQAIFVYQGVQYALFFIEFEDSEVTEVIENLHFS